MRKRRRKEIEVEFVEGPEISDEALDGIVETLAEWLWADLEEKQTKAAEANEGGKWEPKQPEFGLGG